jgi:predicted metal-dependent phosphoesterase TrpH
MIVDRLNELGVPITFEEVEAEAGGPGAQIGRPHFATVLVRHNVVPDFQTAFDEYLAKGARAYVSRKLYKPAEAVELMRAAGVVPVLAHPFTLNLDLGELAGFVADLTAAGLLGVEGYHGDWTEPEQEPVREIAHSNGLVVTGGSDYHGGMRPDRKLPGGKSGVVVPPHVLDDLRSAAPQEV